MARPTRNRIDVISAAAVRVAFMCVVIPIATSGAHGQYSGPALAQLDHSTWTVRDGAPTGVRALAQSPEGALWIGATTGLYRFDGLRFEPFEPPAGQTLPSLSVSALLSLPDGGLWIGYGWGGASVLAQGRLTHFGERAGLPDGSVTAFARDSAGDIWAATRSGLARLRGDRWQRIGPESGYPVGNTSALLIDRRGTLWASTNDAVFALARGSNRFERVSSLDPTGGSGGLREAPDGSVWGTSMTLGLTRLSGSAGFMPPEATAERLRRTRGLLVDRHANAWVMDSAGAVRISLAATPPAESSPRLAQQALPIARVRVGSGSTAYVLFEDRDGNVWVGTNGGLDRFRETKLTPVIFAGPIVNPALAAADGGAVWVASAFNRLVEVDDDVVQIPEAPTQITCAYRDPRGGVWLGSRGVIWYAPPGAMALGERFARIPLPDEAGDVQAIARTPTGDLWVSVRGERSGVFRRRGGVWSSVPSPFASSEQLALTIVADTAGRTWLGYAHNQLALATEDSTHTYSDDDGLHVGAITAVFVRGSRVWVAGELGVMLGDSDRFRAVEATEMLRGITGIVETADGDLWTNGAGGVTHITAAELRRAIENPGYRARAERFDHHDGLNGPPPQVGPFPSAIQGTDGRLWFATENSVAWLDPKKVNRNTLAIPVQIRAVTAAGRQYDLGRRVAFPRGTTDIRFAYTASSLTMPNRVRFRYRLVGLNPSWEEAGVRREAYYANLRPGSYRFEVTAANEDGLWNEAGASVDFTIPATFALTTPFLLLLATTTTGAAAWYLARWRQRRLVRSLRAQFETSLAEHTRVARERHEKLVGDLNGVATQLSAGTRRAATTGANASVVELLTMLNGLVQRFLIDVRRSMPVVPTAPEEVPPLHEQLAHAAQQTFAETAIAAHVERMGTPRQYPPTVEAEIVGIATEAMSNARQHAGCHTVTITCSYAPRELRVRVHDDGRGFDPSQGTPLGQWGLFGMRQRAASIGAQVSVTSARAAGTEVMLVVPGGPGRWTWWGRPAASSA